MRRYGVIPLIYGFCTPSKTIKIRKLKTSSFFTPEIPKKIRVNLVFHIDLHVKNHKKTILYFNENQILRISPLISHRKIRKT